MSVRKDSEWHRHGAGAMELDQESHSLFPICSSAQDGFSTQPDLSDESLTYISTGRVLQKRLLLLIGQT